MSKANGGESGSRTYLSLVVVGLLVLIGVAIYVQFAPAKKVPEDLRIRNDSGQAEKADDVKVFTPEYNDGNLKFEQKPTHSPEGQDPVVFAINGFLQSSKVAAPDAKCLSAKQQGDTMILDFNAPFHQTYGTEDEQTLLVGLGKTVGQFKGVRKVQILVEGKPIETLGNVELTVPVPINGF